MAGRAVAVRFRNPSALRTETAMIFSLVASDQVDGVQAEAAFQRAALAVPELALTKADMLLTENIDFFIVRQALEKLNQLAPLAKPFLIRGMLAAAITDGQNMSDQSADLLRGVCAALDAPVPEQVSTVYLDG